jgi:small subunit ribosomal protein S3Ae
LAPSKATSRAAARKVKDKWRAKNWYRILAPDMFEGVQIGETLADSPDKLKGRILDITLQQLTGDFSKMHIKLQFKINNVSGSDAHSNFIGHTLTSDYIRRLTRRKRSKMDGVYDILTKDGFKVRVKPMAVTEKRIQTSQQYAIRTTMENVIEKHAKAKLVSEFIREMITGELSSVIFKECKPIYPIKRIEIRCSEIIEIPEGGGEMVLPAPAPKKEEAEAVEPEEGKVEPAVAPEAVEGEVTPEVAAEVTEITTDDEAETKAKPKKATKAKPKKKTTKKTTTKAKKSTSKSKKTEKPKKK